MQRMVFVGGLHRSGTTMLARSLAEAPGAAGLVETGATEDEGQHLQDVVPSAEAFGGPGQFALDPAAHLTERDSNDPQAERDRMLAAWRPFWSRPENGVRVEKSPPNLVRMRYLQALFPRACFVVVMRHPLPVGMATRKMSRGVSMPRRIRNWFSAHRMVSRDLGHLERALVVSYESLVRGSPESWSAVAELTGLQVRPPELDPGSNDRYLARWRELREDNRRLVRAEEILHRRRGALARYGYDPDDVDRHVCFPMGSPEPHPLASPR